MAKKNVNESAKNGGEIMGKMSRIWEAKESTWEQVDELSISKKVQSKFSAVIKLKKDKKKGTPYFRAFVTKNLGGTMRATSDFKVSKRLETIISDDGDLKKLAAGKGVKLDISTVYTFFLVNKETGEQLPARRLDGDILDAKQPNVHCDDDNLPY